MALWHNGRICKSARMDATSAGLLLGWGVFTTIGIRDGRPLWLDLHLRRLRRDAARCEIEVPFSDAELGKGLANLLRMRDVQNGLARLTVARQDDGRWNVARGVDCSIVALETASTKTRGLQVCFAPAPSQGELVGVKTTSYLPYFWSWRRAVAEGFDEVILFDSLGRAVEAARASLFWVVRGQLQTTALSFGALEGVGREVVLDWARSHGVKMKECEIRYSDLGCCDEVFLVSAATGPRSVHSLCGEANEYVLAEECPIYDALRAWWDDQ